jgi:kynurenine 3-monooxygenase
MENMIIVGAGLVGSLLSVNLAHAGYKVRVYERNSDPRQINLQSGRSINITLSERGFQALDAVGVGDRVREFCIPVYGRIIHGQDGEITYQPYGNNNEAIYSIGRDDLTKELLSFAEKHENIEFYFNEKCSDIDLPTATLNLQNLETGKISQVQGDRIFAADGAFSGVRRKMQQLKRFNYSQEFCDQGYKEIIIPPRNDNWALDQNAIHIWPRGDFMLIGFPNLDKSFTLSLQLPYEGQISHESIKSPNDLRNIFETYFSDIWSLVEPNCTDYFHKSVEAMITIKCFPWTYQDKVALIGDSCHAIFPSYGQGANSGFEDCQVLMKCIEKHPTDWQGIFQEYEKSRKINLDAIADLCFEHFTELRKMVGDFKFLRQKTIERKLQKLYPDFTSLYYSVSFTCMPYAEALRIERERQNVINKLEEIESIEEQLENRHLASAIYQEYLAENLQPNVAYH